MIYSLNPVFDVIALSEINIQDNISQHFSLNGYKSFFFTRPSWRGGGIAIFVRKTWLACRFYLAFSQAEYVAQKLLIAAFHGAFWLCIDRHRSCWQFSW